MLGAPLLPLVLQALHFLTCQKPMPTVGEGSERGISAVIIASVSLNVQWQRSRPSTLRSA